MLAGSPSSGLPKRLGRASETPTLTFLSPMTVSFAIQMIETLRKNERGHGNSTISLETILVCAEAQHIGARLRMAEVPPRDGFSLQVAPGARNKCRQTTLIRKSRTDRNYLRSWELSGWQRDRVRLTRDGEAPSVPWPRYKKQSPTSIGKSANIICLREPV